VLKYYFKILLKKEKLLLEASVNLQANQGKYDCGKPEWQRGQVIWTVY